MRYLFNKGWKFLELSTGSDYETAMAHAECFQNVQLPHDWLIYDSTDLYRDGTGWYMRELDIDDKKGRYFLEFDAVYMDSHVYVNGICVCEWKYGYSAFDCEITDALKAGKNLIVVSACYRSPNSRWYSGAGIYRNVHIRHTGDTYIKKDGVYISSRIRDGKRILHIETEVDGPDSFYSKTGYLVSDAEGHPVHLNKLSDTDYELPDPHLWDISDTYLYTLKAVMEAGDDHDEETVRFGVRDVFFDPDKGFSLNGRNFKLNGVCEHHDLGALGAAFNKCAMRRKFEMLRQMGVNALRTSHNMPAPEVLDLCDEMGILVISEAFDMWYRPKTEYDYARFFKEWHDKDIRSWIRQDRNHPSVIMWSIGNEIYDCHADESAPDTTRHLKFEVLKHDPYGNAHITFGSNYLPWEGARKCADVLGLVGYNYSEKYYEEHHREHPDWVIYGSETESLVQSRGVYKFPLSEIRLSDADEQCSALGNCNTSWGAKSIEKCICDDRDVPFSCGQFLWTGFDYIGEPTPYHTKNSYFGNIDTAGFPKDYYYVFRSAWTDPEVSPMVHVFPYWDFNPGQMIDVRVCSNEDTVELFVNGDSKGKQQLTHKPGSGTHLIADYRIPYEPGTLEARCYDENGNVTASDIRHSFGDPESIVIKCDKTVMRPSSDDLIFAEISVEDHEGYPVENASDRITVSVSGAGRLVGLDNGDSTDRDSYKGVSRRLFNGKLLAIIAPGEKSGEVKLSAAANGLKSAEITFTNSDEEICGRSSDSASGVASCSSGKGGLNNSPFDKGVSDVFEENTDRPVILGSEDDIPVRKIEISCEDNLFTPDKKEIPVSIKILPENATDRKLTYAVLNDKAVPVNNAEVLEQEGGVVLKAKGDGRFRFRCMSASGTDKVRVISELEFSVQGIGKAFLDPYDFIYGSAYSYSEGDIGAGNEMGLASERGARSLVAFENADFGKAGSDEITIPVFALDDAVYSIKVYDGIPSQGGRLIGDLTYSKPMIWNVYQEDTWKLDTVLKGIHTLSFEFTDKIHVKGFSFRKYDRAFTEISASEADEIYGDDYRIGENEVTGIGNNVSLSFIDMDFGDAGASSVTICGRAPKGTNTIHLRFSDGENEIKNVIEFEGCEEYSSRKFSFDKITGMKNVSFVFMPGSCFDMRSFKFGD
ncbi:MAG: DUF4982 domain-containing protein [Lachnospiraceae bacterium]|nr:DUF4982 domain-containing protein [Lachnospiraceae bacterium]